jgi:hypothetical protein
VGPVGFVLVLVPILLILRTAWAGAQARSPGQSRRLLLFASFVLLLVSLTSGEDFYGTLGVILWFIGGRALAFEYRQKAASRSISPRPSLSTGDGS